MDTQPLPPADIQSGIPARALSLLLVDDEASIRNTLSTILRSEGHRVRTAADCAEALDAIAAESTDIVVSDILLPDGSGLELLADIHERFPDIVTILITGVPTVETAAAAMRGGAFDYLCKPVSRSAIIRSVNNAARHKTLLDNNLALRRQNQAYQQYLEQLVNRKTRRIRRLAFRDQLTGLPNRLLFNRRLDSMITRDTAASIAVLTMDLDQFKNINHVFGHSRGDAFLKMAAERLAELSTEGVFTARVSGDQFLLFVRVAGAEESRRIAAEVLELFRRPFYLETTEVSITASLGISLYPENGQDTEALVRAADSALLEAKQKGKNCLAFFEDNLTERTRLQLGMERALSHAVENEQLQLYFQPRIRIADGQLAGAEALLRWRNPDGSFVSPTTFIPVAEESGSIVPIGHWVLQQACRRLRMWIDGGLGNFTLSVNVAARQFRHRGLIAYVIGALTEYSIPPSSLELEVTESALVGDIASVVEDLETLRQYGVRVAVDDFGTGYSSLSYLKRLPIDTLKIDQSFVSQITEDARDEAITRGIVRLANDLDLCTVAEGVETREQMEKLADTGCDEIQGFLISEALPAEAFAARFIKG